MRIAIEASSLLDHHGGFRTYLEKLIENLAVIDKENEYLVYVARWAAFPAPGSFMPPIADGARVRPHLKRFPYRALLNLEHRLNFRVQERFLLPPLDVFHGACQVLPHPPRAPAVLTVHHFSDLRYHPRAFERFYYGKVYENSIRAAKRIITVSKYTKDFLVERFHLDEKTVTPVYHGVFDPKPEVSADDVASLRERYRLPERFVVCVSRMNPGKNTVELVRAFGRVAGKRPGLGLVLVGWANPDYLVRVRETVAAAGMTVSATASEAAIASIMVNASGRNILPSICCSVNSGRNTITMIRMAKRTNLLIMNLVINNNRLRPRRDTKNQVGAQGDENKGKSTRQSRPLIRENLSPVHGLLLYQ